MQHDRSTENKDDPLIQLDSAIAVLTLLSGDPGNPDLVQWLDMARNHALCARDLLTRNEINFADWQVLVNQLASQEIDRLLLEWQMDTIIAPLLAQCKRPYLARLDDGELYLVIPCDSKAVALLLSKYVDFWGNAFIPFRGEVGAIAFTSDDDTICLCPIDPRQQLIEAGYWVLLGSCDFAVTCETPAFTGYAPEGIRALTKQERESGMRVTLSVPSLRLLDRVFHQLGVLQSLADTAYPEFEVFEVSLTGTVDSPIRGDLTAATFQWRYWGEWHLNLEQQLPLDLLAIQLLFESGLRLPLQEPPNIGFKGLDVQLDDKVIRIAGEHDAITAASFAAGAMVERLKQLRHIPWLAAVKRVVCGEEDVEVWE